MSKTALKEVDRIEEIAILVANKIPGLFAEARDQITEQINAAVEAAQEKQAETDKPVSPTVSLPIAVTWDLDGQDIDVKLSVSVKRSYTATAKLSDPNQPGLPGVEGDATMSPGLKSAVGSLRRAMRAGGGGSISVDGKEVMRVEGGEA